MSIEKKYKSIKHDIFKSSFILSLVILILLGGALAQILYKSGMDAARSSIKQRNYAVSYFIDGYFSEIKSVVEMLADNPLVRHGADLDAEQEQEVIELYRAVAKRHRYVSYLYSGYETNKAELIIDGFTLPEDYDATIRPWYVAAVEAQPELSTGLPYHEITTHEWLLSTGKVLYNQDKKVTGVIAADSSIEVLMEQLAKRGDIYHSSYSYVINPEGIIILHHDPKIIGKNISELITENLSFSDEEGYLSYVLDGINKIAYFSHTYEADWVVVTVVERAEILSGIIFNIGLYVLLALVVSVLLGLAQSHTLSEKFSTPLIRLKSKVTSVVQGDWKSETISQYPNNEIGIISREIDKLTTDEWYAKSQELKLAASVFTHAREGIVITDANANILDVNETFSLITGYTREEAIGQNPGILKSGKHDKQFYENLWGSLLTEHYWSGEIWNKSKYGDLYAELLTISAVTNNRGEIQNYVAIFSNITPMKEHQQQLEKIAHYDFITQLPNRLLLTDRLKLSIKQYERTRQMFAVVYLDLDGFKAINDTYGHDAGDKVLSRIAGLMSHCIREGDTLARVGGDEFVAILANINEAEDYESIVKRLLKSAMMPMQLGEARVQTSVSIGVSLYPKDGASAEELIQRADEAMYMAKQAGKNRYALYK
ncbi:diguanylate cyclase [Vibrio sp. JC009]|uniref:diguanylate cyclase domain-containing protein n=1 Tax=Vibrio sp. JC009 TaxID=2912314 RepID=UPI0023B0C48C|nr:diguanylate cyclase [Vibrio sp. JC009]WED24656.1 diguanylate cyclase [Vibrio sp. JC009]